MKSSKTTDLNGNNLLISSELMNAACLIKNASDLASFENKFAINNNRIQDNTNKKNINSNGLNDDNIVYETKLRIIDILQVNIIQNLFYYNQLIYNSYK
jgi:hypothetical protein